MKLLFALSLAVVLSGCSKTDADVQTGSGGPAPASTASTTGNSSSPAGAPSAGTQAAPAPAVAPPQILTKPPTVKAAPPDKTPIPNRKPKDGDEVAVMETSMGQVVLMFFPDIAPNHVANFKYLARKNFYDGTKFHRIIPNFMIQGGDPNTKGPDTSTWGGGGPGYTINDEYNDTKHLAGILSAASTPEPNSSGSQFFIVVAPSTFLDHKYTAFGKVVTGMDTVEKIRVVPTGEQDRPNDPPVIKSVKIVKWPIK